MATIQRVLDDHRLERARVFVGDAEAIDAPDARFDVVVDYGILHHIPNWPQALKEITRVLKPDGTFYFEDTLKGFTSTWPVRHLFDHPQTTQFYGHEFRAGWRPPICVCRIGNNGENGVLWAEPANNYE